jgi:hypothetical protein
LKQAGHAELVCNIGDAKHTNNDEENGGESVTTGDQEGLFACVAKGHSAAKAAKLFLGDVRLLFVTNRKKLAAPTDGSDVANNLKKQKKAAKKLFSMAELELLNKDSFEFGPFSDIIQARRKKRTPES